MAIEFPELAHQILDVAKEQEEEKQGTWSRRQQFGEMGGLFSKNTKKKTAASQAPTQLTNYDTID